MPWSPSLFVARQRSQIHPFRLGPVVLALPGSFHFFKTGHKATLAGIQWESAFIPLYTIKYPWSPILVALNSIGAQILAAAALPLIVQWERLSLGE